MWIGIVRRGQSSIYINVAWVGREGLKGWRREVGGGLHNPGERSPGWQTGELLLSLPSLASSIEGVLTQGGGRCSAQWS